LCTRGKRDSALGDFIQIINSQNLDLNAAGLLLVGSELSGCPMIRGASSSWILDVVKCNEVKLA
jgi:hypothetical protein